MTDLVSRPTTHTSQNMSGYTYEGETLRHVAMPLGGIGAGQIALGGDGGLRQWQIVNQINHQGFVPHSFFALRVMYPEPPLDEVRILQSQEILQCTEDPTPLVNDDAIPAQQRTLLEQFKGIERTTFTGAYPFARIHYEDMALPLDIEMEAYSPFIPLDAENSGLPAILFTFTLRNNSIHEVNGCIGAALQNAVGWDGLTPIDGNRCPLYGGNVNQIRRRAGYTALVLENPSLADDDPGAGQMVLTHLGSDTRTYERWTTPEQFMRFLEGYNPRKHLNERPHHRAFINKNRLAIPAGVSPAGETWNGGLAAPFTLAVGEVTHVSFILSWYFPNHYLNFDQFGPRRDYGKSRFWLGNAYTNRFGDAIEVAEYIIHRRQHLEQISRLWAEGIYNSTLPDWIAETLAAQGTLMRSPTTFLTEDGKFYGFAGSLGLSTGMWNASFGGSCPLNCTHVWNYEVALSRLFPRLEQSMRETDLLHAQSPEGYIPHRTVVPLYLPQFWNEPIGGPTNPALDGMLGTILKVYREVRQGAGQTWLDQLWPNVKKLVAYIITKWDEDGDGVLQGEQPNTYDIAFYGPNIYIGALWLAALRAAEELAKIQGENELVQQWRQLFDLGSIHYDGLLWNGEYYIQLIDAAAPPEDQFGTGCLADQLFGQWWAHTLDLGYILPEQHVKTTLQSIVKYNLRHGFRGFEHGYRVFADRDDSGLLVCTWPLGGRPEVPVRYCDEVWTGMEYHVAAHCIMEGLLDEGLSVLTALRGRYNGSRRNPYNEIECGDHYARTMAGWSLLEALSGSHYNALTESFSFAPTTEKFRAPFIAASGWGTFEHIQGSRTTLTCTYGMIHIAQLSLSNIGATVVVLDGAKITGALSWQDDTTTLSFVEPITLHAGSQLTLIVE